MSYPMMGDGLDSFKRSPPDWKVCEQILTLMTSPDTPATDKGIGRDTLSAIYLTLIDKKFSTSYECAFWLPHGGHKWGNNFTVQHYRAVTKKIRREKRRKTFEVANPQFLKGRRKR